MGGGAFIVEFGFELSGINGLAKARDAGQFRLSTAKAVGN